MFSPWGFAGTIGAACASCSDVWVVSAVGTVKDSSTREVEVSAARTLAAEINRELTVTAQVNKWSFTSNPHNKKLTPQQQCDTDPEAKFKKLDRKLYYFWGEA
jgi:hypothetical protein